MKAQFVFSILTSVTLLNFVAVNLAAAQAPQAPPQQQQQQQLPQQMQQPADVVPLTPPPPTQAPPQPDPFAPPQPQQPQALAPGPGTSQQPAPVNIGNQNVPPPPANMTPPPPGTQTDTQVAPTVLPEPAMPDAKKEIKRKVQAVVRTSMGNFTIKLFTRQAPRTTKHFMDLARGEKEFTDAKTGQKVRRPFYNGLILHRVIKNFIIQGGCPFGNGTGGPGFTIADEFTPSLRHRKAGIVSMANAGQRDTNGSQFFITLAPEPDFDDKYTIFGEVVSGMDVIRDISRVRVGPTDRPVKRITIIGIDIKEQILN
jgi:peptidyl-prolyl cis-trans isomerase A (cyclophilin A)